jgi:CheY-like chemotaxis protein
VKILVADDSRIMRQIVIRTLRQAGYDDHEIVEAQDGREAADTVGAGDIDLVLCDWHMPEMTGIECLQALRAAGNTVPFGFITSDVSTEMRQKAVAAGALFFLGKPFNEEMLQRALAGVLDPAGANAGTPSAEGATEPDDERDAGSNLPTAKEIRDMFSALLGRSVTVASGRRVQPTQDAPATLATYVDAQRTVTAVCLMDLRLSAYAAGAFALLPPGGVQDAVEEDGELSAVLVDSLHEVANVLSGQLTVAGRSHATLGTLYAAGSFLPEELLVMASGFDRLDLVVDVPGYGKGSMSLVWTG